MQWHYYTRYLEIRANLVSLFPRWKRLVPTKFITHLSTRFTRLHYYKAADALQSYLSSIKCILDEDPTNVDNPQMVISAELLLDHMPHPHDYKDEMDKYHQIPGVKRLPRGITKQAYTQLHSTLMGEMKEIQARFTDTNRKT